MLPFSAFLLAAFLLAITPGPGITYVVARTVVGGRAEGLASCLGAGMGGLAHVAAAALGLSVLVAQSAVAFSVLKYAGAAYLAYMGLRMLLSRVPPTEIKVTRQGARRAMLEGIVVEALNVKTALFFLAFLPQFVDPASAVAPQLVMLGCLCVLFNTIADVAAVLAAHHLLKASSARATRARMLSRASGVTMLGLSAFLALARREA